MLMTIDAGNTNQRYAIFEQDNLITSGPLNEIEADAFIDNKRMISQVKNLDAKWSPKNSTIAFPDYSENGTFLDMPVHYQSGLGQDRLALAYLAYRLRACEENETCLVIDAGTFTTVDIIDQHGFQGGFILPGDLLLTKTFEHGQQLFVPQFPHTSSMKETLTLGRNTNDAMSSSLHYLLSSFYGNLLHEYRPTSLFITGGNAQHHLELLNIQRNSISGIKTLLHPLMIHFALRLILEERLMLNPISTVIKNTRLVLQGDWQ